MNQLDSIIEHSSREIECILASLDGDFALKVDNADERRHEFVMRIATGEMVPDRFCFFDSATSMVNFAEDAMKGVPLLQSHNSWSDVGIGYTFLSEHLKSKKEVNVGAYVSKGYGISGTTGYTYDTSDDYILALENKDIREVSMGIYGGRDICSICGGNIRSYRDCSHFPGREYEIGEKKIKKLCTYTIYDARLDEVSLVANGAVPGAMILKAQEMIYNKEIDLSDVEKAFSQQYPKADIAQSIFHNRVYAFNKTFGALPELTQSEPTQQEEPATMPQELQPTIQGLQTANPTLNIPADPAEALNHLTRLAVSGAASQQNADQLQAQLTTSQQTIATLQQDKAKLELAANDGQTYRQEWYTRAKAAHVARFGSELAEIYASLFDNQSTPASEIRKYAEQWEGEVASANQNQQGATLSGGQAQRPGVPRTQDPNPNPNAGGQTSVLIPKAYSHI